MSGNQQKTLSIESTPLELRALLAWLKQEVEGVVATPAYTQWSYKTKDCSFLAYNSGKLVINSKEDFNMWNKFKRVGNQRIVTPTKQLTANDGLYAHPDNLATAPDIWQAGMDESGKGDLFGPQVTACVVCNTEMQTAWRKMGVKDSKELTIDEIHSLAKRIRATPGVKFAVNIPDMNTFNTQVALLGNQNTFLLNQHLEGLEVAVTKQPVSQAILDQFTSWNIIQAAIPNNLKHVNLRAETKAERYTCVAAASILAREAQLNTLKNLSVILGENLLRGCSGEVKAQASRILHTRGIAVLRSVAKMNFKTVNEL